jgi:hypothetical protein
MSDFLFIGNPNMFVGPSIGRYLQRQRSFNSAIQWQLRQLRRSGFGRTETINVKFNLNDGFETVRLMRNADNSLSQLRWIA